MTSRWKGVAVLCFASAVAVDDADSHDVPPPPPVVIEGDSAGMKPPSLSSSDGLSSPPPKPPSKRSFQSPFGWWQGHMLCTEEIAAATAKSMDNHQGPRSAASDHGPIKKSFRLLGIPSKSPPQPHDCWKGGDIVPDLHFWTVTIADNSTLAMSYEMVNVMCSGGDAVTMSTRLDPAIFSNLPSDHSTGDASPTTTSQTPSSSSSFEFHTRIVQVDQDALVSIRKYFPALLVSRPEIASGALVCIGDMEICL
ncbi:hypothetical protein BSLG_008654 [Batrachochytrium salamandrivorans]|nr:hypothetical protein BASA83_004324 [Batrachochytrium salamandrivorans]KAJ1332350.1 hypothetical protein BSLG_008654 [Batrachochytrium salamandrivorans]